MRKKAMLSGYGYGCNRGAVFAARTGMQPEAFVTLLYERRKNLRSFPDKRKTESFIDDLFHLLFISQGIHQLSHAELEALFVQVQNRFEEILFDLLHDKPAAKAQSDQFFAALHGVYDALTADAEAIYNFDPAARSMAEVLAAYPGFYAIAIFRLAHQLWTQKVDLLPRLFTEFAHSRTGIDIHPGAKIGVPFSIDHGTGVVIGETSVIGSQVKIYQGVTLGALNVSKEDATIKRHPTIGDGVVIYSNATILGGDTVVGRNSIVGGNVWLTASIPPNCVVYHKSEVKVKDKNPFEEPINFVI
jgi:serine O-acetyltransferase